MDKLWARATERLEFEVRPELPFIRSALRHALAGLLSAEDSEDKTTVVMSGSLWLARMLGLSRTKLLVLDFPDFTIENLALLSDAYDFVIADRALHRCDNLEDAAHETMRVLKPGGIFVHTRCALDMASRGGLDFRRLKSSALMRIFQGADPVSVGGGPLVGWVAGRKIGTSIDLPCTAATRVAKRRGYRFAPSPAKFGVVGIAKNEAPYLLQWIAHYRVLGFQEITIYDNQSNDASSRILSSLSRAGIINAVFWSDRDRKQVRAYNHAARRLRRYVEWCLFVDLDEFLVLDPGLSLGDLLPVEPEISAVGIPWRMFGSGGQRMRGTELVIERFTKAAPTFHRLVKSLVRLRDLGTMGIHTPRGTRGRVADIKGLPLNLDVPRTEHSVARINHYFSRSWEEFASKRLRGDIAKAGSTYSWNDFDRYGSGEVELRDALPLAPAVRDEMARLRRLIGCYRDQLYSTS